MSTCGLLFLWNQYNVSEWNDMSTCGLLFLFQRASTIKIQLSMLV